jgi:KaiC/GvpD/RAD55 family RecA-like ATPase
LKSIEQYYDRDPKALSVDLEILHAQLAEQYPQSVEDLALFFGGLPAQADEPNIKAWAREVNKSFLANELQIALAKKDDARIIKIMQSWGKDDDIPTAYEGSMAPSHFFGAIGTQRIPLFPLQLNEKLDGGVFRQAQCLIMARPNVGKSTFAINTAACLARNGFRVLYMPNEDPHRIVISRLLSRFVGVPFLEIHKDQDPHHTVALSEGFDRLVVQEINPGSIQEIRAAVARYKPDVFIVDQIYKIAMESKDGAVQTFANISSGCRTIAKEFNCASILVTQVADAAKDKLFLAQEDVEWSNTGVCAQMDLMIGLAQSEDLQAQHKMMVSFPRWKWGEKPKPFTVNVDYQFNKIT